MISCKCWNTRIKGPKHRVRAELGVLLHEFLESEIITEEELDEMVRRAKMSDEELEATIKKNLKEIFTSERKVREDARNRNIERMRSKYNS